MSHRRLIGRVGPIALVALLVVPAVAPAAKKHRKVRFTNTITAVAVDATHSVYSIHDSYAGDGAGTQTTTINAAGTGGTDSEITYYAHGSARSHGTFTIGAADASGMAPLTGSGQDTGGTGKFKGVKSIYTFSGSLNTKTGGYTVTLTGTYTF